jgi:hypothetical protein
MDAIARRQHHARVRVDDCFGPYLVRVVRERGAGPEIQPQALASLAGWWSGGEVEAAEVTVWLTSSLSMN